MPLFGRKEGKVPLTEDVLMSCICGACPVQAESVCSKPKIAKMMEMKANMSMRGSQMPATSMSFAQEQVTSMKLKLEEMPGPYCSIGVATCTDLDSSKACICNQCKVYENFCLVAGKPVEHFCFNGKAI